MCTDVCLPGYLHFMWQRCWATFQCKFDFRMENEINWDVTPPHHHQPAPPPPLPLLLLPLLIFNGVSVLRWWLSRVYAILHLVSFLNFIRWDEMKPWVGWFFSFRDLSCWFNLKLGERFSALPFLDRLLHPPASFFFLPPSFSSLVSIPLTSHNIPCLVDTSSALLQSLS